MNHLAQLGRQAHSYLERDVHPIAIGPSHTGATRIAKLFKLPFPLLADPDNVVYTAYGIGDDGDDSSGSMVIARGGTLMYAQRVANPQLSMRRKEVRAVIETLPAAGEP